MFKKLINETFIAASKKHATLIESLTGLESIKTLGAEGFLQNHWEQEVGKIAKLGQRSRLLSAGIVNTSAFIQQIAYVAFIQYIQCTHPSHCRRYCYYHPQQTCAAQSS